MLKLFRRNRHPVALAPTPTRPTSGSSWEQETIEALHQRRLDALTMPTVTDAIGSYLYYKPQDAHSLQARRHILQAVHTVVNTACSWIKVNPGTGGLLINLHHSAPRKNVAPSQLDAYLRGIARHAPSYGKYPVVHIADLSDHAHTLTINHDRDGYMLDSSNRKYLATPVPIATIEEAISLIRQEKS